MQLYLWKVQECLPVPNCKSHHSSILFTDTIFKMNSLEPKFQFLIASYQFHLPTLPGINCGAQSR